VGLCRPLAGLCGGKPYALRVVNIVIENGWIGVDLFVVISGYVIAMVIEDLRRKHTDSAPS